MVEVLGKIPAARISSLPIVSFAAGIDQRGAANIPSNALSYGRNVMITQQGLATHRYGTKQWLPDAVGTVYEVCAADYNGTVYYIIADDGEIKYCQEGDTNWTIAGGTNSVTTTAVVNTHLRTADKVLILNGTDDLGYLDLSTMEVVVFAHVDDPTSAPTGVPIGISGSTHKVYYAIWYNGVTGTTDTSPILTQDVDLIREQWASDGSQGVTVTDPNTRPTGAVSWNIGVATGAAGGTIATSDILWLAVGLDISSTTYVDNGLITPDVTLGTAPDTNTTTGAKARYGNVINGIVFLWGMPDDPYAVLIGGGQGYELDFTPANGGYRLVLNDGTDFLPSTVVGFRNGSGTPSITVLYSSVTGLSNSSIVEQSTVSLGTYSAIVWGATDNNYGSAGVSSPYGITDYRGTLIFPSTDGITSVDTSSLRFNVLTAKRISDPVINEISSIQTQYLPQIVSTAWDNRVLFSIPAAGFTYNNELLIYDVTNQGEEKWYIWDIPCQWVGTISPPGIAGFVYISQGNHFFRLDEVPVAQDEDSSGVTTPFSFEADSALIGTNAAHDGYYALVQAVFYLVDFIGNATLIVTWRDRLSGQMVTSTELVSNGSYQKSSSGGWSSSGYQFNQHLKTKVLRWGNIDVISGAQTTQSVSDRYEIKLDNVVTQEMMATVALNPDNSGVKWRSVSFQGQPLGISPDIQ
jgi:hypothetical protein